MEENKASIKVMKDNIVFSNNNLQKEFLEMGEVLFKYKISKAFKGEFVSFKVALGDGFNLDTSTANGLIKVYKLFVDELAWEKEELETIGFDKLKQFAKLKKYMDNKALNIYIEDKKDLPLLELKDEIKVLIDAEKASSLNVKEEFKKTVYDELTGFFNCSKKDLEFKFALLFNETDLSELDNKIREKEEKFIKEVEGNENL